MIKSDFKYSNPKLIKLDFEINDNYESKHNISTKNIAISLDSQINKTGEKEAIVELKIEIGKKSDSSPLFMYMVIGAKFILDNDIEGTNFDNLLKINAPALLLSYARPIVASVTMQAGLSPLNIPFFNFAQ